MPGFDPDLDDSRLFKVIVLKEIWFEEKKNTSSVPLGRNFVGVQEKICFFPAIVVVVVSLMLSSHASDYCHLHRKSNEEQIYIKVFTTPGVNLIKETQSLEVLNSLKVHYFSLD